MKSLGTFVMVDLAVARTTILQTIQMHMGSIIALHHYSTDAHRNIYTKIYILNLRFALKS